MQVKAVVPYYGSKRTIAPVIVEELGDHHSYWEPFCGSCAVLLAKPVSRMEVLNDLNEDLINLLRVVQDDEMAVHLFEKLNRTAFCDTLYEEAVAWMRNEHMEWLRDPSPAITRAYYYFVVSWMGRNGLVGTANELKTGFCKRFTSGGGDPATRFRNAVASLPAWWERLRLATVLSEDGIKLIERIEDKKGCVIYVDPPYLDKKCRYAHDFVDDDHQRLANVLMRFVHTKVVVSYYDNPALDDLYTDWRKKQVSVTKNMSCRTGAQAAPEVLLINQP